MDTASKGRRKKVADSAGALTEASGDMRLLDVVEAEIIPRLMMAHRDPRHDAHAPAVRPEDVVDFSRALLSQKITDATEVIGELCERGVSMEAVYLQLLALALPATLGFRIYASLNHAISRPRMVMLLQISGLLLKIPLNALFIFGGLGLPAFGAPGCAMATAISAWLALLAGFVITLKMYWLAMALHTRRRRQT